MSLALEEFQRRGQEAFNGLTGIANMADDILCFGLGEMPEEAEEEHDKNLELLNCADQRIFKLNPKKMQFKLPRIAFMESRSC